MKTLQEQIVEAALEQTLGLYAENVSKEEYQSLFSAFFIKGAIFGAKLGFEAGRKKVETHQQEGWYSFNHHTHYKYKSIEDLNLEDKQSGER